MSVARNRVLIVDDDEVSLRLASSILKLDGYEVYGVRSAIEAIDRLASHPPDLVLLDILMPVTSGLAVLEVVLRDLPDVPVILVTSLGADESVARGLRLGADDYVVKPFSPPVLVERVRAVLRRGRPGGDTIVHGPLKIDTSSRQVWMGNRPIELRTMEFDLLAFLARHPMRVFTRQQLLVEVWKSSDEWQGDATVTEHVARLRTKLDDLGGAPSWVQTVRGVGYRFDPPADG